MTTVLLAVLLCSGITGVVPAPEEFADRDAWVSRCFGSTERSGEPFISFTMDEEPATRLLPDWHREYTTGPVDETRERHTLKLADSKTGLVVRCEGIVWKDYPTVEWTVYFRNEGLTDTPLLESIQALDSVFHRGGDGEFLLHYHHGDRYAMDSFAPMTAVLKPDSTLKFAPEGGRPTNGAWPYYNLEFGTGSGVLIAVGWPGQWATRFVRDGDTGLRIQAGQEQTRLVLHPGEEIRTPLIVLQFYRGDWLRAQNIWRRWMFSHNFPLDHGKPLGPKLAMASFWPFHSQTTQEGEITFLDICQRENIPLTTWWIDAGWYVNDGGDWGWPKVGTWEVDRKRFPGGLKAVSDHAHAKGIELLVWFEVERVAAGSWIAENHPEWVYGGKDGGLLRMDDPEVRNWITNHIDQMITEEGIDFYRSDFNIDPLPFWRGNDPENRQGITEIRYVEGYLQYFDELRRRHPGMLIDSCASGGRRDDLETMRRAVPLLRTDLEQVPEAHQSVTFGFDLWLPYHDSVNWERSSYGFRSTLAPFLALNWDVREIGFNFEQARQFIQEWQHTVPYFFGDFYPVSPYGTGDDVWLAWQLDRPDLAGGVVQAFRREKSPHASVRYPLRGLDSNAVYVITSPDNKEERQMTGRELMEEGLPITLPEPRSAALFFTGKPAPDHCRILPSGQSGIAGPLNPRPPQGRQGIHILCSPVQSPDGVPWWKAFLSSCAPNGGKVVLREAFVQI